MEIMQKGGWYMILDEAHKKSIMGVEARTGENRGRVDEANAIGV